MRKRVIETRSSEDWLKKAKKDLRSANNSLGSGEFEWATFQLQQAIEKALKAILIKKEKQLVKNHDLVYLGNKLSLPENYLNYCKEISPFYTINRYPDIPEINLTKKNIETYLCWTREILEWCEKQI